MIVEPGEDLDVDEIGETVMGEVGLPQLVGLLGFETDEGRAGPLRRRRRDQAMALQSAVDRCSRHPNVVVLAEMPADGVRAGVETSDTELSAKLNDQLDRRGGDRRR